MESFESYVRTLAREHGLYRPYVVDYGGYVDLKTLKLPPQLRGRGVGSAFLRELCAEADRRGEAIGACPKEGRTAWLERHGFVENADLETYRVTWIRFPQTGNPE